MGRVADILSTKGAQVHTVSPDTSAFDAVTRMLDAGVGSLLVVENDAIAGIFTERDYLRRVTLEKRDPNTTPVRSVMTPRVIYVDSDKSVQDCMSIMTQRRIRHLPVMDADGLRGVISIGDLVKFMSQEREVEIRFLTEYITGRPGG
jgi:CBS domain-containing protein